MKHYHGPASDHFDGSRFFNPQPITHRFSDLRCWWRTREHNPWTRITDFAAPPAPADRVDGLRITWINHATVLIQAGGCNIITDPVFSARVGPFSRLGPRRYHPPGVAFDDLPPIDVVLVSHAHYDHLDQASIRRLAGRFDPLFVGGLGLDRPLRAASARRIHTVDWWQAHAFAPKLRVVATPARHWSRRGVLDRNRSLWVGYWLETPSGNVFFAGDTGFATHFSAIRQRLGAPRAALLPIGAYAPRWFMAPQHMNPAEAVEAHRVLGATQSIGIHFATFKLSDEGQHAPEAELNTARAAARLAPAAFVVPRFGQGFDLG